MWFLHPWAIGMGALAALLPLAIHFLTRPKPIKTPLPTIRFVREALQEKRARHRLRDWTTLLLRMLAAFLVGVAISRPILGPQSAKPDGGDEDRLTVVLLDVSQSMGAIDGGASVMERAREIAARRFAPNYVGSDRQGALILAAARSENVLGQTTTQLGALREEVGSAEVRPEGLDVAAALRAAGDVLVASSAPQRELVIVSDFQRSNWSGADFSGIPAGVAIAFESAAAAAPPPNLAIVRAECAGRVEQGRPVRLEVDVANHALQTRSARVEVTLGDVVFRMEGACPAGMRTTLASEVSFQEAGWQIGAARLTNVVDAVAADNERPMAIEVRPPVKVALVSREPNARRASASYFLERALMPAYDPAKADFSTVGRIEPGRLLADQMQAFDVLALVRPGKLSESALSSLAKYVQRGRSLLYVVCEGTDVGNLNLLKQAAGVDWRLPVEFVAPAKGRSLKERFLTDIRASQPPFAIFGDELTGLTAPIRFSKSLLSRPVEGGLADDLLASLNDRSASLVASACGAGNVVLWNVDLAATNLTSSPLFVPMVSEMVEKLLARRQSFAAASCGLALSVPLPPAVGSISGLETAFVPEMSKNGSVGELTEDKTGVYFRSKALAGPGTHLVRREGKTVFAIASAAPPEESDLRSIQGSVLTQRLARGRAADFRSTADLLQNERDDVWTYALVAAVGCILAEWVILRVMRT